MHTRARECAQLPSLRILLLSRLLLLPPPPPPAVLLMHVPSPALLLLLLLLHVLARPGWRGDPPQCAGCGVQPRVGGGGDDACI